MKRLLIYLKRHPLATLFAPLFKMLEASFELFVPLVVAKMIDIGIYQKNAGYLWRMGALLVLLGIIGFGFAITAQYFAAKSAVSTGRDLRNDLFAHINTLSFKEIDTLGTSTLINRMTNDVNQVQNGINMFLRLFLRSPFVVFGAMVMAFTVGVKAAIPFVIVIPALAVVVFAILLPCRFIKTYRNSLTMFYFPPVKIFLESVLYAHLTARKVKWNRLRKKAFSFFSARFTSEKFPPY